MAAWLPLALLRPDLFGASGSFRHIDHAVASADVAMLLGLAFVTAAYVACGSVVVDLALRLLDPRIAAGIRS